MSETTQSLPQSVIDEAWSEFVYPRAAVGDLSHPSAQSGFMRAMRVIQQWATEHDAYWAQVYDRGIASSMVQAQKQVDREATEIRQQDPDRYGEGKADGLERAGTVLHRRAADVLENPVKFAGEAAADV